MHSLEATGHSSREAAFQTMIRFVIMHREDEHKEFRITERDGLWYALIKDQLVWHAINQDMLRVEWGLPPLERKRTADE